MDREDHPMNEPSAVKHPIDVESPMIVSTPGTCGGKPRIDGHRIRVQDVVVWTEQMGMTVEEIVSNYPGMTLEKIAAALDYYEHHREEIASYIRYEDDVANRLDQTLGSILVRFPRKPHGADDPVPSG
jgi:uncharacterized protein (DUF433 family)